MTAAASSTSTPSENRERALGIMYDLALTVGCEVELRPLLTKVLDRLIHHTGLAAGLALQHDRFPADALEVDTVVMAVAGDCAPPERRNQRLMVPAALLAGGPALVDQAERLSVLPIRGTTCVALRLPVEGFGALLLTGPALPEWTLSFPELLAPILDRLACAVTLSRSHEREMALRLRRITYFDPLTELPNAILFADNLRQAMLAADRTGSVLAVVTLDIDDFKGMGGDQGAKKGDLILVELARRLEAVRRPGDMVARLSGDEFAVLFAGLSRWQDVQPRINAALAEVTGPLDVDGRVLPLSISAGVATYPADSSEVETLMRNSQIAMLEAKREARGSLRFFDSDHDRRARERRSVIKRISAAFERGELCLYYQPQVDLLSGRIHGFEALLRWLDPKRGEILPGEFLPQIGDSDLIVRIGDWAIREALRQAARWRENGLTTRISVNIAGRHLQLPDFVDRLIAALAEVPGADPTSLEIEILESSAIESFAMVRDVIERCRALGVVFALDDFGTGYSSLAYLRQLPASVVKIDQVFVRNMFNEVEDPAIIQAVVQIADIFKRQLVAEGVESLDHAMFLISMGCPVSQGFGISRPIPAADVPAWAGSYRAPPELEGWRDVGWHPWLHELFRQIHAHRRWQTGDPGAETCRLVDWIAEQIPGAGTPALDHAHRHFHILLDKASAPDLIEPAFTDMIRAIALVVGKKAGKRP